MPQVRWAPVNPAPHTERTAAAVATPIQRFSVPSAPFSVEGRLSLRGPTEEEEAAAERAGTEVKESVADAYEEANETGANVEGEGAV